MANTLREKETVASFLKQDDTFATTLLILLLDNYGTELLDWHPLTIWMELYEDFGVTPSRTTQDKILAAITAITSDTFFRDPLAFIHITDALSGEGVDFEQLLPPDPEAIAWAITEVLAMNGHPGVEFTAEIRRLIGVALQENGVYTPPDVLKLADYPKETTDNISQNVDPDPAMYAAHYRRGQESSDQITQHVKSRLNALVAELDRVPLQNRDKASWKALIQGRLGASQRA